MLRLMLVASFSGIAWGVAGYLLVRDTNMASGAWAGLMVSPMIGLLIGVLAVRTNPAGILRQAVFALVGLYIAVAMFAATVGLWHVTVGWNLAPSLTRGSNRPWALLTSVLSALMLFTVSGWVLLLWPVSLVNHRLIWSELRRRNVRTAGEHA
jgi:hypothetical protein